MIHQMMDVTAKRRYSMGRTSSFSKNFRDSSIIERRTSLKPDKAGYRFNSSNIDSRVSDFKLIKPCFVKLDKICDKKVSELLAKRIYSDQARSNSKCLGMSRLQSDEMNHNPYENLGLGRDTSGNANINVKSELIATENHLDLLMAGEMDLSHRQNEKRFNGRDKRISLNGVKNWNLNPVVCLKRLSPQFISKAINGKLELECGEFNHIKKRKVESLRKTTAKNEVRRSKRSSVVKLGCSCCTKSPYSGLRRSERLSNISLSTEDQSNYFSNRRNSSLSRKHYKIKDDKERIFGNKENISRLKKRSNEKISYSDDEEEFYGFENQTKNRQRLKRMKEALKTLNAHPSGKEKPRIFRAKTPLKTFYSRPSGKENGRGTIFNGDFKSLIRHKIPFKTVNRVEGQSSTNEDILLKNPTIEDYQSSISYRNNNSNVRNKVVMVPRNNAECNDADADISTLNRLEILKLFKKREKLLINKMVRDQGKVIVSKKGELFNEDKCWDEPLNYYSSKYYIKKTGRRIPLWAEESIRNVIIQSQDQIPVDIIVGYFQGPLNLADPTCIAEFLGSAFLENNTAVKR